MPTMMRAELTSLIAVRLPNNASGQITPARLREVIETLLLSAVLPEDAPWAAQLAAAIAAAAGAYATAAQGARADSATQPAQLAAAIAAIRPVAGVRAQAGTAYVLALADAEQLVEFTSSAALTVTAPSDAVAAFPVGASVHLCQAGAGVLTVVAGSGAVVRKPGAASFALAGQESIASLIKSGPNAWRLVGDLG